MRRTGRVSHNFGSFRTKVDAEGYFPLVVLRGRRALHRDFSNAAPYVARIPDCSLDLTVADMVANGDPGVSICDLRVHLFSSIVSLETTACRMAGGSYRDVSGWKRSAVAGSFGR